MEKVLHYFEQPLHLAEGKPQRVKNYLVLALIVATGVLILHMFIEGSSSPVQLLQHAVVVTGAYVTALIVIDGLWRLWQRHLHRKISRLTVGTAWSLSLLTLLVGYLLLAPMTTSQNFHLLHTGKAMAGGILPLLKFLPIWALITGLLIHRVAAQQHLATTAEDRTRLLVSPGLSSDERVKPLSELEPRSGLKIPATGNQGDRMIPYRQILYIQVVEHYCNVFVRQPAATGKYTIHSTLRQFVRQLPATEFVQCHRSYIVNRNYVIGLRRKGRDYFINLDGVTVPVPVSRSRVSALRCRFIVCSDSVDERVTPVN